MKNYRVSAKSRQHKPKKSVQTKRHLALTPKITRSTGIKVDAWMLAGTDGTLPGGGYEGATKGLDNTVQKEAKILGRMLHKPIEIRFNSDRQSGGAWVKDTKGCTQVGLNAGLRTVFPQGNFEKFLKKKGLTFDTYFDLKNKDYQKKLKIDEEVEKLPKEIYVSTMAEITVLKDSQLEHYPVTKDGENVNDLGVTYDRWHDPWNKDNIDSVHIHHKDLASAVAWLRKNVEPRKITK